jgi:glycosyltransferase involved in cell wall biosynthesis
MNKSFAPKVSVIVPVYNAEQYLEESLSCIVKQTLRDIEIICVNDGSTDSSLEILNVYAKNDNRITIINQENQGAGAARNAGLMAAQGDYLSFLDSDDIFSPTLLKELYSAAITNDSDIAICDVNILDDITKQKYDKPWSIPAHRLHDDRLLEPFCASDIPDKALEAFIPWVWDKLFRTRYIKRQGILFSHLRFAEEQDFVILAMLFANKIVTVNKILISYRTNNPFSREGLKFKYPLEGFDSIRLVKKLLLKNELYTKYEESFINWSLQFNIVKLFEIIDSMDVSEITVVAAEKYYNYFRDIFSPEIGYDKYPQNFFHDLEIYKTYICIHDSSFLLYLLKTLRNQKSIISELQKYKKENRASPTIKKGKVLTTRKFIKYILPYGFVRIIQKLKQKQRVDN